jgi:hypothetical protein
MTGPQIYLLVFLWIDGSWVPGWNVPGWSPRQQDSVEECLVGAEHINRTPKITVVLENGEETVADKLQGRCFVINAWPGRSKG